MGKGCTQDDEKVIAKRAFQSVALANCNYIHLYLDGLKNPLFTGQTPKKLFLNKSDKQSGDAHA